jgi:2-oxo-3-hexenedioate decarboxylase
VNAVDGTVIDELAAQLDEAVRTGVAIPQLTSITELDVDQAYAVQHAGIALRRQRGEEIIGAKLGFTSKAKAEQMGVSDVIIGVLTSDMAVLDGGTIDLGLGVHPRVEPEVAFRLGSAVDANDPDADLLAAVTQVAPALEVIDSRYRDFKFSLADVVADNTSASRFVIGPWRPFAEVRNAIDLAALDVELRLDGEVLATGSTADILGDPVQALPATQRMAARYGHTLPAGSVVLAGAATAAVALTPGVLVQATVFGLGSVSVHTMRDGDDG